MTKSIKQLNICCSSQQTKIIHSTIRNIKEISKKNIMFNSMRRKKVFIVKVIKNKEKTPIRCENNVHYNFSSFTVKDSIDF